MIFGHIAQDFVRSSGLYLGKLIWTTIESSWVKANTSFSAPVRCCGHKIMLENKQNSKEFIQNESPVSHIGPHTTNFGADPMGYWPFLHLMALGRLQPCTVPVHSSGWSESNICHLSVVSYAHKYHSQRWSKVILHNYKSIDSVWSLFSAQAQSLELDLPSYHLREMAILAALLSLPSSEP